MKPVELDGTRRRLSTCYDIGDLRAAARRLIPRPVFDYVDGGSDEELVRGVERLDFSYGVQDADGKTSFLTANQVEASTDCPPSELNAVTTAGCLWRAINSIEVSVLMDGQVPLYTLGADDLKYAYTVDGNTTPVAPGSRWSARSAGTDSCV